MKGTQLKTLRRENKSSETFIENVKKKASQTRCLTFAPYAWRRFTPWGVMRCGRGLRATHYIVQPRLTVYAATICSFSLFTKPVLINFKKVYQNGYSIFKFSHFYGQKQKKPPPKQWLKSLMEGYSFHHSLL